MHKKFRGFGYAAVLTNLNVASYYNLILAFSYAYLFASFQSPLPWTITPEVNGTNNGFGDNSGNSSNNSGGNFSNTSTNQSYGNHTQKSHHSGINNVFPLESKLQDYFYKQLLHQKSDPYSFGEFNGQIYGFYLLSILIVFLCIAKGIKSSGKVALVTASAPYVMITILLLR